MDEQRFEMPPQQPERLGGKAWNPESVKWVEENGRLVSGDDARVGHVDSVLIDGAVSSGMFWACSPLQPNGVQAKRSGDTSQFCRFGIATALNVGDGGLRASSFLGQRSLGQAR